MPLVEPWVLVVILNTESGFANRNLFDELHFDAFHCWGGFQCICFVLSRLGITDTVEVMSLQSSCECIRPTIVHFYDAQGKTTRALRIDFPPESAHPSLDKSPCNLTVNVTVQLNSGLTIVTSLRFLHTKRVQGAVW